MTCFLLRQVSLLLPGAWDNKRLFVVGGGRTVMRTRRHGRRTSCLLEGAGTSQRSLR